MWCIISAYATRKVSHSAPVRAAFLAPYYTPEISKADPASDLREKLVLLAFVSHISLFPLVSCRMLQNGESKSHNSDYGSFHAATHANPANSDNNPSGGGYQRHRGEAATSSAGGGQPPGGVSSKSKAGTDQVDHQSAAMATVISIKSYPLFRCIFLLMSFGHFSGKQG